MKTIQFLVTVLVISLFSSTMTAQEWQTPTIDGYGRVKYFKDAAVQPSKEKEYKILFHLTSDAKKDGVNSGLWHMARQVNLFGVSGVPARHVKIVGVISGPDTDIILSNAAYKKRHNTDNPNMDILKKLSDYGVKFDVCGQAAAEHNIDPYTELNPYIELTLSALIDVPTYQMKGYVIMF